MHRFRLWRRRRGILFSKFGSPVWLVNFVNALRRRVIRRTMHPNYPGVCEIQAQDQQNRRVVTVVIYHELIIKVEPAPVGALSTEPVSSRFANAWGSASQPTIGNLKMTCLTPHASA